MAVEYRTHNCSELRISDVNKEVMKDYTLVSKEEYYKESQFFC